MATTEFATGPQKGAGAGFLFLLGFALVATGVGFALAPHYSWQVTKIAHRASELGVQNGVLLVGGLVLFGLSIVARSAGATTTVDTGSHHDALQADLQVLDEQLSAKIGQLRTALMQVQEGVNGVANQQQEHFSRQQGSRGEGADHSQEALFRLAASLDKLHAHFDERVHAVDLQLRSGFESLLNVSHDLRRVLDVHSAPAAGPAGRALPTHAQPPQEGTIDFYQTMQKLDAIAGASEPQPAAGAPRPRSQPQAPFPSAGGESLDALLPEEYRDRY